MIRKIAEAWNRFFFTPVSPASLGVFRIVFGFVVLHSLIGKFIDRGLLYGANGLVSRETAASFFSGAEAALNPFHLVPSSDPSLAIFFIVLIAATLALIIGFQTRISSVLLFVGLLALSNRNFFSENAGDDLIRINCFFLMFAPAGAAYSVDQWLAIRKTAGARLESLPNITPWALRLLQLQLAYLYLDTVYLKLHGQAWRDGTALYYALNYIELKRLDMGWFFHSLWQIKLGTWATLVIEAAMGTLVWIRRFRYPCLLAALGLHLFINLAMQFPVFQYAMIASLIVFIEPRDIEVFFKASTRMLSRDRSRLPN